MIRDFFFLVIVAYVCFIVIFSAVDRNVLKDIKQDFRATEFFLFLFPFLDLHVVRIHWGSM